MIDKYSQWLDIFGFRCKILKGFYNMDFKERKGKSYWYSKHGSTYGVKLEFSTEHMESFSENVKLQSKTEGIITVPAMYRSQGENKLTNIEMYITGCRKLGSGGKIAQFILKIDSGSLEYVDMTEQESTKYIRNENLKLLLEES
jgi:hypothetical protein